MRRDNIKSSAQFAIEDLNVEVCDEVIIKKTRDRFFGESFVS
jgi:hypothetical protein